MAAGKSGVLSSHDMESDEMERGNDTTLRNDNPTGAPMQHCGPSDGTAAIDISESLEAESNELEALTDEIETSSNILIRENEPEIQEIHAQGVHDPGNPSATAVLSQTEQSLAANEASTDGPFLVNLVVFDGVAGMEVDSQPSDNDADSAIGESIYGSSTSSVRSSVYEYIKENGRTYHAYNSGKYHLPNDEAEQDRLDLQHQLFLLSLGDLHLVPISKTPHNVLDIGTGTGIWAIEFAQKYPSANVVGSDLSPIQPEFVPPNCQFEVNDVEEEWSYTQKFDYIHGRALTACFRDPSFVLASAFDALEPGGWLEMQDPTMPLLCIDNTMEGTAIQEWMKLMCTAGEILGRCLTNSRNYKRWMEEIGFVDVEEVHFPWAINPWPRGKKEKLVALWMQQDLLDGLHGMSVGLLTRGLGWSTERVELLLVGVRNDIKNRNIHTYIDTLVVYGRKSEE